MISLSYPFKNMEKDNDEKLGLVYDLRQAYAKIVGDHLNLIALARVEEDYPNYFRYLKNLYVVVKHKIKATYSKQDEDEEEKKEIENYDKLLKEAIKVINNYPNVYTGQQKEAKGGSLIEQALMNIEMFLYQEMDEAGMFGKGYEYDADEI